MACENPFSMVRFNPKYAIDLLLQGVTTSKSEFPLLNPTSP
jgi:hypothetical protein